ncbi:MAG: type II toxin-antitoxin system VapC family toxin [Acidobacteriia bacterium]|nr:type II toxin-antitoxin system VapC family toxin [Terriglobia bacterium]
MKLLLDTHIWLWSQLEAKRLSIAVAAALQDAGNEIWLSPISVWEASILSRKGKVHLEGGADVWVRRALRRAPVREAALTIEVALASNTLKMAHPDPADRFLVATAKVFGLTLVTADRLLIESGVVDVLANQ